MLKIKTAFKLLAATAFIIAATCPALAATCPAFYNGQILTAAQWQACFDTKQNALGYTPLNQAGDTMTGKLTTAAPTTSGSGFVLQPGTAPTAPVAGALWSTSAGLYAQVNGITRWLSQPVGMLRFSATVDFNATGDTQIAIVLPPGSTTYLIDKVVISNASASLAGSAGGLFTGTGGTGLAIVTGATSITVTSPTPDNNNNAQSLTVNNAATESFNDTTLYFNVSTAVGSAATGSVTVFINPLP